MHMRLKVSLIPEKKPGEDPSRITYSWSNFYTGLFQPNVGDILETQEEFSCRESLVGLIYDLSEIYSMRCYMRGYWSNARAAYLQTQVDMLTQLPQHQSAVVHTMWSKIIGLHESSRSFTFSYGPSSEVSIKFQFPQYDTKSFGRQAAMLLSLFALFVRNSYIIDFFESNLDKIGKMTSMEFINFILENSESFVRKDMGTGLHPSYFEGGIRFIKYMRYFLGPFSYTGMGSAGTTHEEIITLLRERDQRKLNETAPES